MLWHWLCGPGRLVYLLYAGLAVGTLDVYVLHSSVLASLQNDILMVPGPHLQGPGGLWGLYFTRLHAQKQQLGQASDPESTPQPLN